MQAVFQPRLRGLPRTGLGPPLTAGSRGRNRAEARSRAFSLWRSSGAMAGCSIGAARSPVNGAQGIVTQLAHPPSTAGLNRFAASPVNGADRKRNKTYRAVRFKNPRNVNGFHQPGCSLQARLYLMRNLGPYPSAARHRSLFGYFRGQPRAPDRSRLCAAALDANGLCALPIGAG
jgi:hypothetical protein